MTADFQVPTLHFLCLRAVCVRLFKANVAGHKMSSATGIIKDYAKFRAPIPRKMREKLHAALMETVKDVNRWWEKNSEIFPDTKTKSRRAEHLLLFFEHLEFNRDDMTVDDLKSARKIIEINSNWPQLQFQLACAYAQEQILAQFDKIRLRVFRKRLTDHPLYDFWHLVLSGPDLGAPLFEQATGLAPNQTVSLLFQWALANGFKELAEYLWARVTPAQREYVGLLQWRRLCSSARHGPMFKFLCLELCGMNDTGVTRITWQYFYDALLQIATEPSKTIRELNFCRLNFILKYGCSRLRTALLKAQNYRALQVALQTKECKTFYMLQGHLTADQLRDACIYLESAGGVSPQSLIECRRVVTQRQWSFA